MYVGRVITFLVLCFVTPILPSASATMAMPVEESLIKRIVYNNTDTTLYVQWYIVTKKTSASQVAGSETVPVGAKKWAVILEPSRKQIEEKDLRLVCSFYRDQFTPFLDCAKGDNKYTVLKVTDKENDKGTDLVTPEKVNVFIKPTLAANVSRSTATVAPEFCKTHMVVSVLNTTNKPIFCAPYSVPNDATSRARSLTKTAKIEPQHTHLFTFDPAATQRATKNQLLFSSNVGDMGDTLVPIDYAKLAPVNIDTTQSSLEKEYLILPLINLDTDDDTISKSSEFAVVPPQALKKPRFLIDQFIARFHTLPELNATERAEFESSPLKEKLGSFDRNIDALPGAEITSSMKELHEELDFVKRRKNVIKTGLKKLFTNDIKDGKIIGSDDLTEKDLDDLELLPSIALVSTGGGYRAMIETIGFLEGAKDADIFDCLMYMCGLSGSTWAINSLVASNKPVVEFAQDLKDRVSKSDSQNSAVSQLTSWRNALTALGSLKANSPYNDFANLLFALSKSDSYKLCKFIQSKYAQSQGFVGLYGHALVERLLIGYPVNAKKNQHSVMLSDLRANLAGDYPLYPLPISVCLQSPSDAHTNDTYWFEFSPYYVGTHVGQNKPWHIPTSMFGSFYESGKLAYRCPEYPLGQLFGTFGSAMAVSEETIATHKKMRALSVLALMKSLNSNRLLGGVQFDEERMTAGVAPNFLYNAADLPDNIAGKKFLRLVDGGQLSVEVGGKRCCHNFATVPALQRECDVLILTDCNGQPNASDNGVHLKAAIDEGKRLGFKMPSLSPNQQIDPSKDYSELIGDNLIYILCKKCNEIVEDFDPDASVSEYTATSYFFYEEGTYDNLKSLAKGIFKRQNNIDNIKRAILTAMSKKKKARQANPEKSTVLSSSPQATSTAPAKAAPAPEVEQGSSKKSKRSKSTGSSQVKGKKKNSNSHGSAKKDGQKRRTKHDDDEDVDDKKSRHKEKNPKTTTSSSKNKHDDDNEDSSDSEDLEEQAPKINTSDYASYTNYAEHNDDDAAISPRSSSVNMENLKKGASTSSSSSGMAKAASSSSSQQANPVPNVAFNSFMEAVPNYAAAEFDAMKLLLTPLTEGISYEFFAEFMDYAAEHDSIDLIKLFMEKAEKAPNHPSAETLKKIYAFRKQEIMTVGAEQDYIYCPQNRKNPLHWAAEHKNEAIYRLLLYKNIFALQGKNLQNQTPLHVAFINNAQKCIHETLLFFEGIDSITIDNPKHTDMLKGLVKEVFTTKDATGKTVSDYAAEQPDIKKRIRKILIKYYISSGL